MLCVFIILSFLSEFILFWDLSQFLMISLLFLKSVPLISEEFKERYLSNPEHPNVFEGKAVMFEGPEDYHRRINSNKLKIDEHSILMVRGCGPVGYPGSAEVVNMQPPDRLLKEGINALPTLGDGRQSGTSESPSILNVSPESAIGGDLAIVKTGDRIKIDLNKSRVDLLISAAEFKRRRKKKKLPKLIMPNLDSIDGLNSYSVDDFVLEGYESHPALKAPMAI